MSGPKVVRIRTRAERVADGEAALARVEAAARRWERAGLASPEETAHTRARAGALARLLAEDRFAELERDAAREIAFLDDDLAHRQERAAAARARARSAGRRLASAADTVLRSLAAAGREAAPPIAERLAAGRAGTAQDLDALAAAIDAALALLAADDDSASGRAERAALAARLAAGGEGARTLAHWQAARPGEEDDDGAERIEERIGRLETEAGAEVAAPFAERARAIAAEPSLGRRRLLRDSLELDLAGALAGQRARARIRAELETLAAELALFSHRSGTADLLQEIAIEAARDGGIEPLHSLRERAAQWLAARRAELAAEARRDAVLAGLAALGYEVREGMGTLWSEGRRLVVRSAAAPDLGLELAGDPGGERLQMVPIGFEAAPGAWDHTRDRDVETRFCADLGRLEARLAETGVELAIDRALPVGAKPLRTVALAVDGAGRPDVTATGRGKRMRELSS